MKALLRDHLLIVLVAGVVLFFNLGASRLWDRDEPRNAGCAVEMLERGDWIVPVFNAELRGHKPVLLYWLMMSAYTLFGVSEFAARFWSATLGVGTVVLTYHIGRHLFDMATGRWAAIVLATALMFDVASRAATPDSALIFFSTLGLAGFVVATFGHHRRPDRWNLLATGTRSPCRPLPWAGVLLMYAPLGFAALAKGPVGVILPMAVIGMFLLIQRLPTREKSQSERRPNALRRAVSALRPFAPLHFLRTYWSMRPMFGCWLVLAIALPWYICVGIRTNGAWLQEFFLQHNVGRAMAPMEGHDGGLLFYPVAMLIGLFPWSILAVPVLLIVRQAIRHEGPNRDSYVFCACWVGVYVALFSIARTKLPSYVTPAYPAVALLIGGFLRQWVTDGESVWRGWLRIGWATLSVVGVAMVIGLTFAAKVYLPGDEYLACIGLIPLIGGVSGWMLSESGRRHSAAVCLAITAALLSTSLLGIGTARVDRHQQNHLLLRAVASRCDKPQLAAFGNLEPSWVFYARQPIQVISPNQPERVGEFLRGGANHFLITTAAHYRRLRGELPNNVGLLETVPYFLKDAQLVVIGDSPEAKRMADSGADTRATR